MPTNATLQITCRISQYRTIIIWNVFKWHNNSLARKTVLCFWNTVSRAFHGQIYLGVIHFGQDVGDVNSLCDAFRNQLRIHKIAFIIALRNGGNINFMRFRRIFDESISKSFAFPGGILHSTHTHTHSASGFCQRYPNYFSPFAVSLSRCKQSTGLLHHKAMKSITTNELCAACGFIRLGVLSYQSSCYFDDDAVTRKTVIYYVSDSVHVIVVVFATFNHFDCAFDISFEMQCVPFWWRWSKRKKNREIFSQTIFRVNAFRLQVDGIFIFDCHLNELWQADACTAYEISYN